MNFIYSTFKSKFRNAAFILLCIFICSCSMKTRIKLTEVGKLTLVSTKNITFDEEYNLLQKSAGFDGTQVAELNNRGNKRGTKIDIIENYEKLKDVTIAGAINNIIETVPGGVFMENAEIYISKASKFSYLGSKGDFYIVSGDVYGLKENKANNVRGFYMGCKALYKERLVGKVVSLIDGTYCLFQEMDKDVPEKVLYDELLKIGE